MMLYCKLELFLHIFIPHFIHIKYEIAVCSLFCFKRDFLILFSRWTEPDKVPSVDSYVEEWLSLGVEYVGGCCRTNAEDIRKMRAHMDRWLKEGTLTGPIEIVSSSNSCIASSVGCH